MGLLAGLVIASIIMLVLQIRNSTSINKLTFPAYEYVIKKAEHQANEIINEAQKQARLIVTQAEQGGQKTVASYTQDAAKAHESYLASYAEYGKALADKLDSAGEKGIAQLQTLQAEASDMLTKQQNVLKTRFDSSLLSVEKLASTLEQKTTQNLSLMETHIAEVGKRLVDSLQTDNQKQKELIASHLEKALDVAEEQIATYQKARVALLDTHIERLVEDITARVLHKKLSISEHAELAREALAEAKAHNLL